MNTFIQNNALRAIVKQLNKDLNKALDKQPKSLHLAIMTPIIDAASAKAALIGFTHTQMIYAMAVMNGIFKEKD
jgi:hypothetical protein